MKTLNDFTIFYGTLDDAVIREIDISYLRNPARLIIKTVVDCMSITQNDKWVVLEITFYDVQEFRIISELNMPIDSIGSFAANQLSDGIIFNFSPNVIPPEDISEHRDSAFYIISKEVDFRELHPEYKI